MRTCMCACHNGYVHNNISHRSNDTFYTFGTPQEKKNIANREVLRTWMEENVRIVPAEIITACGIFKSFFFCCTTTHIKSRIRPGKMTFGIFELITRDRMTLIIRWMLREANVSCQSLRKSLGQTSVFF